MQVGRDRVARKNWSLLASAQRSGYRHVADPRLSREQVIKIGLLIQEIIYILNNTVLKALINNYKKLIFIIPAVFQEHL